MSLNKIPFNFTDNILKSSERLSLNFVSVILILLNKPLIIIIDVEFAQVRVAQYQIPIWTFTSKEVVIPLTCDKHLLIF